jgi:CBS domain-containing protein
MTAENEAEPQHTGEEPRDTDDEPQHTGDEAQNTDEEPIEPELISGTIKRPHHPPPPPSLRHISEDPSKHAGGGRELEKTPKLVADLMTRKLFTIEADTPLENLEAQMKKFRFRHLPVVDGDELIGLISYADLLHASSSFLSERAAERDALIHRVPASRIMHTDLVTVRPTDTLADAAKVMWEARLGCLPVTSDDGKLLGIITEADFIRLAHHLLEEQGGRGGPG